MVFDQKMWNYNLNNPNQAIVQIRKMVCKKFYVTVDLNLLVKNSLDNWHWADILFSQYSLTNVANIWLVDKSLVMVCWQNVVNQMAFEKRHITKIWVSSTNNCSNRETYPAGNDLIVALICLVKKNNLANWHLANTMLSWQSYALCGQQLINQQVSCYASLTKCL